ncbi:MAG: DUF4476 domain-containing protein [Bacteroidetes bacterium]|nr:DUF4476 domain-containing protein [Bacteroidota bacterium]
MPRLISLFIWSFLFVCSAFSVQAQRWSYVYIQGDKQTPFYVKLEGEMLPRYSKNYYILPQLEAGPIHVQILFQQNEYPVQNFTVLVPENGSRGFLLTRKENTFSLYDIQQRFYLFPGEEGEDHLPEMITIASKPKNTSSTKQTEVQDTVAPTNQPKFLDNVVLDNVHAVQSAEANNESTIQPNKESEKTASIPPPISETPNRPTPAQEQPAVALPTTDTQPITTPKVKQKPFNIAEEQTVEEAARTNPEAETPIETQPVPATTQPIPTTNPQCPNPLDDEAFDKLFAAVRTKSDDEKRAAFLMKKAEQNCFSSRQAFFLAKEMQPESMRYSFLKKAYPRITDQQNFPALEGYLFQSLEWKSYFRLIYQ